MENQSILEKCLLFILEHKNNSDETRNLLQCLDMEEFNKLLLQKVLSRKIDHRETSLIFKKYISYLSVDQQIMFFNTLFYFSKTHQNVDLLSLSLEFIDRAALKHDMSILRTIDFWDFLKTCILNSKDFLEARAVTYVLQTCQSLTDIAGFQCPTISNDEQTWKVFLTLMQVLNCGKLELLKPSIELLDYISTLHYFWKSCIFKILLKQVPVHLKCKVLALILKEDIKEENLREFMKFLLLVINERNCKNTDCLVLKEITNLCENTNVNNFTVVLDEILNIRWNRGLVWPILRSVLVDSKKNLVDFNYYFRIEAFFNLYNMYAWSCEESDRISLFWNSKNFDRISQIIGSSIPFYSYELIRSEEYEEKAILKILELSNSNSDDINDIKKYLAFIEDRKTLISNYSISIHVRILIYEGLFRGSGSGVYGMELNEERTVNDFYEYLMNYLNEKTYFIYTELMNGFLELMDRMISFLYPEKACAEILNIMRHPESYTKYQVYSATKILRYVDYRFPEISYGKEYSYYKDIASTKWKYLIVDTDDEQMCKEGLYYVLGVGQLKAEEYDKIIKKLLERHPCDQVTEKIFDQYLNIRLLKHAFIHLKKLMEKNPTKREKYSELFCNFISSEKYLFNNQTLVENTYLEFCYSSSNNMGYLMDAIQCKTVETLKHEQIFFRIMDIQILIYLHKLSNASTRARCLNVFTQFTLYLNIMKPTERQKFKRFAKWTIYRLKEMYATNIENEINKLRIIQALTLLVPCLKVGSSKVSNRLVYHLKRIAVGILVKESKSNNYAVKQICQFMYVLLCKDYPDFEEIKCVMEKVKERPDLASSFIPVLYHLIPFCKRFSSNRFEEILTSIVSLSLAPDKKLRVYTQVFLQHFYNLLINTEFNDLLEKYDTMFKNNESEVQNSREIILDILKTDYVFLKFFDTTKDHSAETILYIFPKLNQVNFDEWKDIMENYNIFLKMDTYNKTKDFIKAVNLYLDTNGKYVTYSANDILKMFPPLLKNPAYERC